MYFLRYCRSDFHYYLDIQHGLNSFSKILTHTLTRIKLTKNLKGDGSIDYDVIPGIPGYLPTASPSEQSTRIGK